MTFKSHPQSRTEIQRTMAFALQPRPAAIPLGTENRGSLGSEACNPPVAFLQEMGGLNLWDMK